MTIAADAVYQGTSDGEPRNTDHPAKHIEDISAMVDFISQYPDVDPERIGALGVCGSGYTLGAAQQDKRIKAVTTLSMFNTGRVRRNDFADSQLDMVQERLQQAVEARAQQAAGGEVRYTGDIPHLSEEQLATLPFDLYRDGYRYYYEDYAHPRSTGRYTVASLAKLMAWDATDRMDLLNQPLLMIAGSVADTRYMTENAYVKATAAASKQLLLIEGASHIRTYFVSEYVGQIVAVTSKFFTQQLAHAACFVFGNRPRE